jgi:hypothetical protein
MPSLLASDSWRRATTWPFSSATEALRRSSAGRLSAPDTLGHVASPLRSAAESVWSGRSMVPAAFRTDGPLTCLANETNGGSSSAPGMSAKLL